MSKTDYAKYKNITRQSLYQYEKKNNGQIIYSDCGKKIDVEETDKLFVVKHYPKTLAKIDRQTDSGIGLDEKDILTSKKEFEFYKAKSEKLKYEEKSASLVDRGKTQELLFAVFREFRDSCLAIPARVIPKMQNKTPHKQEQILLNEVKKTLNSLTKSRLSKLIDKK